MVAGRARCWGKVLREGAFGPVEDAVRGSCRQGGIDLDQLQCIGRNRGAEFAATAAEGEGFAFLADGGEQGVQFAAVGTGRGAGCAQVTRAGRWGRDAGHRVAAAQALDAQGVGDAVGAVVGDDDALSTRGLGGEGHQCGGFGGIAVDATAALGANLGAEQAASFQAVMGPESPGRRVDADLAAIGGEIEQRHQRHGGVEMGCLDVLRRVLEKRQHAAIEGLGALAGIERFATLFAQPDVPFGDVDGLAAAAL